MQVTFLRYRIMLQHGGKYTVSLFTVFAPT